MTVSCTDSLRDQTEAPPHYLSPKQPTSHENTNCMFTLRILQRSFDNPSLRRSIVKFRKQPNNILQQHPTDEPTASRSYATMSTDPSKYKFNRKLLMTLINRHLLELTYAADTMLRVKDPQASSTYAPNPPPSDLSHELTIVHLNSPILPIPRHETNQQALLPRE